MKLEDLLAKYLIEWPDGAEYARQDADKEVCFRGCSTLHDFFLSEMADDASIVERVGTKRVYKHEYLAARDRLHAATVKDLPNKTVKNPELDKSVWLDVAKDQFNIITKSKTCRETLSFAQAAEFAFDAADAFCAEMEKRK